MLVTVIVFGFKVCTILSDVLFPKDDVRPQYARLLPSIFFLPLSGFPSCHRSGRLDDDTNNRGYTQRSKQDSQPLQRTPTLRHHARAKYRRCKPMSFYTGHVIYKVHTSVYIMNYTHYVLSQYYKRQMV